MGQNKYDEEIIKEYEEIQRRRELWSNVIVSRDRLFFPLAIAVFAYLGAQLTGFINLHIANFAFIWGGVLLFMLLVIWRWLSLHVDKNIVKMYQEEVALEKRLKFNSRSKYIYENLSNRSKKHIADLMGKKQKEVRSWTYGEFSKVSESLKKPDYEDYYDYLIAALRKFGYCSVSSRGHWIWHLSAFLLILFWVSIALWWELGIRPTLVIPSS